MASHIALPPVDPNQIRPTRKGYVVAGIIAGLSVLVIPVLVLIIANQVPKLDEFIVAPIAEFDPDKPAEVQLTAAKRWAIFVEVDTPAPTASASPSRNRSATPSPSPSPSPTPDVRARCTATGLDGGTVTLGDEILTSEVTEGARTWRQLYTMTVTQDGRYRIFCEPIGTATRPSRYAVGEEPDIGGFLTGFLLIFASGFGIAVIPCVGVFIAALIAGGTAIARYNDRRRLQRRDPSQYRWDRAPGGRY